LDHPLGLSAANCPAAASYRGGASGSERAAAGLSELSPELGCNLEAGVHQPFDRFDTLHEHRALGTVQVDLDDTLDATRAEHHRDADIEAFDAILAV